VQEQRLLQAQAQRRARLRAQLRAQALRWLSPALSLLLALQELLAPTRRCSR
jgi:hypothetical protein